MTKLRVKQKYLALIVVEILFLVNPERFAQKKIVNSRKIALMKIRIIVKNKNENLYNRNWIDWWFDGIRY
jgi:hypothetical protein